MVSPRLSAAGIRLSILPSPAGDLGLDLAVGLLPLLRQTPSGFTRSAWGRCAVGVGASYTPRSSVPLSRSRPQTPERMRPLITVSTGLSVTFFSFDASTKIHSRSPVRPSPDPVRPPGSGSPWTFPAASHRSLPILHAPDGDGIEHYPGSIEDHFSHATSCRTGHQQSSATPPR